MINTILDIYLNGIFIFMFFSIILHVIFNKNEKLNISNILVLIWLGVIWPIILLMTIFNVIFDGCMEG